jgi:hypothetical protein
VGGIKKVVEEIQALPLLDSCEILVGDGGSTDGTRELCGFLPVKLFYTSLGKGSGVRTLIPQILGDKTIMVDSDFTYSLSTVPLMLELLKKNDIIAGERRILEAGSMKPVNKFGNKCLSLAASIVYQRRIKDLCTGLWAFNTPTLRSLNLTSTHFTLEVEIFVRAAKLNIPIYSLPIVYRKRQGTDTSKLMIKDGFEILKFLIKSRTS